MSQAPYMPVFVDALIGATVKLTAEQFGAYCFLLFATWSNNGNPLPDDDQLLARICHCTPARWRQMLRPSLIGFFDNGDGFLHQKRLEKEWNYVVAMSEKRRAAGSLGGQATALKYRRTVSANARANAPPNAPATPPAGLQQDYQQPNLNLKRKGRESLVVNTQSPRARAREATESDTKTRPSLSDLGKDQEGEAEPRQSLGDPPEGWLAEAEAAREEAGLEPVNLRLEWGKFAARADGPVELRRWVEWSLRAWVSHEHHASGTRGPPDTDTMPDVPWAARMRQWRREGWWLTSFGPKPGEQGCWVPVKYLEAAE